MRPLTIGPVKFCILSREPRNYSTKRLKEAAQARDVKVRVLDALKMAISADKADPRLYYKSREVPAFDAVIPRIGASITFFGTAVVRQFAQMGVFCANSATGIANSRDKLRSLQILSRFDIGIPPTEFVRARADVLPAIERVGGAPVIIKLLEGTQGVGVILADSTKVAQAIVETLQSTKQNVLIQKFVKESRGRDIRAFVVGDRVVGAMRRVAQGEEFRSNVHRGGRVEAVKLDEVYEETAVRAAQIMGLRVAGVDMLEGADGPQLMEVNSSPGLEGIEAATGHDIAGEIIAYVRENVRHPELDIRQRLTVSRGYDVVEFTVGKESELAGKPIRESGLRDRDVVVLSLTRGRKVIANPRSTREIEAGDTLLCYGNLANIRDFLPPRARRRRKIKRRPDDAGEASPPAPPPAARS